MQPDQGQYDFIWNSGQSPKAKGSGGKNSSLKSRYLIVLGVGAALLITFGAVFAFVLSGTDPIEDQLYSLAKQQSELIRVAQIGVDKAKGAEARNLAITTQLSLASNKTQVLDVVRQVREIDEKKLTAAAKNDKTDEMLVAAEQNNRFDEVFIQTIHSQLRAYRLALKSAFDASTNDENKKKLSDAYNSINALLPAQQTSP